MKLLYASVVAVCAAAKVVPRSSEGGATCSSLNGPFCQGIGLNFAVAPLYTRQNLDIDEEKLESAKTLKIEKVLKQYTSQKAENTDTWSDEGDEEFLRKFNMLLEESVALQVGKKEVDDKMLSASTLESSSTIAALELLRLMNGDELKDFFEMALDEVLRAGEVAPHNLSSKTLKGIHITIHQFKALIDYSTYQFQQLGKLELITIRSKFAKDRLVELQQAFMNLVLADSSKDRQVAFETAVYLFQLAQEDTT